MLYDMRTTARGGGGVGGLRGMLSSDVGGGVFQTDVGTAGQSIIIWPRPTAAQAAEARAGGRGRGGGGEGGEGGEGRLAVNPYGKHELEILKLAPFVPPLQPQELGRVWELRWFDYAPGGAESALAGFERALPNREQYYPVVGVWSVEVGPTPDRIYVLAPFKDWDHRDEVMGKLRNDPAWPPQTDPACLRSGARLMTPAGFSPLR